MLQVLKILCLRAGLNVGALPYNLCRAAVPGTTTFAYVCRRTLAAVEAGC